MSVLYQVLVLLALLSGAMLAGLMIALLAVLRPMWDRESDEVAAHGFQAFLRHAATNRVLASLSVVPVVCVVVIAFLGGPTPSRYVYALVGGGVFLVGFFLWTAVFNLPIYRAVTAWDLTESKPAPRSLLRRFHRVNLVRLVAALASSVFYYLAA